MGHMFGDVKPIDASLIFIFRSCFSFFFSFVRELKRCFYTFTFVSRLLVSGVCPGPSG